MRLDRLARVRSACSSLWPAVRLPARRPPAPRPASAPGWEFTGQARVTQGAQAMVVSGSPIASEVGRDILRQGGNAVDAAVAVGFALAVVHPEAGNIGGGGFMVIRLADGTVQTLDYRETAPAAATRDMYLDAPGEPTDRSVTGHLAAGRAGRVAGLTEAHRRYGRLPFAPVIAAGDPAGARRLRRWTSTGAESIGGDSARLALVPGLARQLPARRRVRRPPGDACGSRSSRATLEAIRDRGAAGFYRGRVADLIVAEMERGGGLIIARRTSRATGPSGASRSRITYRGYTIYSMPPASSGGVTMGEILNIMEGYDPLPPFGSPALLHREAEAMRRAFTDRNTYLGDPAFVQQPDRPAALQGVRGRAPAASIGERATPTPAFDAGARARARRPRTTRWWTPRATR